MKKLIYFYTMLYTLLHFLFPRVIFKVNIQSEKVWFLTFDDGPTEEVTDWVLELLNKYDAKATFFCLGIQVENNIGLFEKIKNCGHEVGNHSYSHLHGWKTSNLNYSENIARAHSIINSQLFRPPYGKMGFFQYLKLRKKYKIILWNQIVEDWKFQLKATLKAQKLIKNAENGSIFLFHDNEKSSENLKIILPKILDFAIKNNIKLKALSKYV